MAGLALVLTFFGGMAAVDALAAERQGLSTAEADLKQPANAQRLGELARIPPARAARFDDVRPNDCR